MSTNTANTNSTAERNMAAMRTAYATLVSGDLDACVEMLTEDFVANLPGLPEPVRSREVWRMGAEAMLKGFPDLRIDVEHMAADGDQVAVRARFSGTHKGEFGGVPATGRSVDFWSVEYYRFVDGKVAEEWVAPDMGNLMHQITAE
ncbi:ester cyclase [Allokutzneria sp. NRRL B-24872]|uniref:ester cyclase n=1 Tax=Allokutzneria sp. NRRL B-24872 TaxID=1137961 RepID=UPI001AEFE55B|nr:ester cyclase [Allokutzneria sp. NRRL B-24872]